MAKDYYKILGVDKSADEEQIKKAFRKLAHEHHPDKKTGNADKFKEINEAYQVLGNKDKRQQYDQFGAGFEQAQGFGGGGGNPFGGFDFGNMNFDFGGRGGEEFDLGDIFGSVFGGSTRRSRSQRGSDIQVDLEIELADAVFGKTEHISLRKQKECQACHGTGAKDAKDFDTCPTCSGSGQVASSFGPFRTQSTCPECLGQGKIIKHKCATCHGQGVTSENVELNIEIPAGIDNGQAVRISGQGNAGERGQGAGDLYVRVHVRPHRFLVREGFDLHLDKKIPFTTAALGGKILVETIDGQVELKIPSGTPSGKKFILREKGVGKLRSKSRGDEIVTISIDVPTRLSKKQKKLLEELEQAE